MTDTPVPFDRGLVAEVIADHGISVGTASIREVNRVINAIEERLGANFIRMEFGIPGLPVDPLAEDIIGNLETIIRKSCSETRNPENSYVILRKGWRDMPESFPFQVVEPAPGIHYLS